MIKSNPYIIAEIGANHNGDMQLAKDLIKSASMCGAHAVKFQSWTVDSLISQEEYERNQVYNDSPHKHFGSLRQMVEKYALTEEQHFELFDYTKKFNLDFISTPFSFEEVDLLCKLGVPIIKIASMDINNHRLLSYIAKKGKPIILSTGMADLGEIEYAIKTIENQGNFQIILLHCISIYPPENKDVNLNNITMLKQTFGYPVGFSDHSIGTSLAIASVALGSCVIEKHFTLDKSLPGWDHEISADPSELIEICKGASQVFESLGSHRRIVSQKEIEKRKKFRRSAVSSRDIKKGEVLRELDIVYKRPGDGFSPNEEEHIIGKTLSKDIKKDTVFRKYHFIN